MPEAARITDTVNTGHLCDTTTTIKGNLQSNVYINGLLAAVKGDLLENHTILAGSTCIPHVATVLKGSASVYINNIRAARKDDEADTPGLGKITGHSPNVYIGGASTS